MSWTIAGLVCGLMLVAFSTIPAFLAPPAYRLLHEAQATVNHTEASPIVDDLSIQLVAALLDSTSGSPWTASPWAIIDQSLYHIDSSIWKTLPTLGRMQEVEKKYGRGDVKYRRRDEINTLVSTRRSPFHAQRKQMQAGLRAIHPPARRPECHSIVFRWAHWVACTSEYHNAVATYRRNVETVIDLLLVMGRNVISRGRAVESKDLDWKDSYESQQRVTELAIFKEMLGAPKDNVKMEGYQTRLLVSRLWTAHLFALQRFEQLQYFSLRTINMQREEIEKAVQHWRRSADSWLYDEIPTSWTATRDTLVTQIDAWLMNVALYLEDIVEFVDTPTASPEYRKIIFGEVDKLKSHGASSPSGFSRYTFHAGNEYSFLSPWVLPAICHDRNGALCGHDWAWRTHYPVRQFWNCSEYTSFIPELQGCTANDIDNARTKTEKRRKRKSEQARFEQAQHDEFVKMFKRPVV